jgi:amino acid transporter
MNVSTSTGNQKPHALSLLASERPRNVSWLQAGGLLFGDWGTSRLYVLGLAFFFAGRTSFYLVLAMSALIVAVGWAYTQICRIYPDGGGVYTAAKHKSRNLAVIGALLLFADYTVTASLSALDAFHYFGLPLKHQIEQSSAPDFPAHPALTKDAGDKLDIHRDSGPSTADSLLAVDSPGLWAIVAILLIGAFNFMGPKHTGGFAFFAAVGMMVITLTITVFAVPKISWHELPSRIGHLNHPPGEMWIAFVSIVLALSGVEAIANLTGVMKRPVAHTARKAIWVVTAEVAIFNIILAIAMLAIFPLDRDAHLNDMLAFLSGHYIGNWGEWGVRILGGLLLLSATNTAITDMISVQYLMARDGEVPRFMQKLNRFGVPWIPAVIAASVPAFILIISHDLESLAALYAIGVIGAVAINVSLCSIHPRLRRLHRKVPMMLLGTILLAIWVTLACTKLHALLFVSIVIAIGLSARALTKWYATRKGPRQSLLHEAILEQITPQALAKPRLLVGTYGSEQLAPAALIAAKNTDSTLVICFIREVALSFKYEGHQTRLTLETDLAAQRTFARYLELAHQADVSILPVYDTGANAPELIAENAAVHACSKVLIGSSRRGMVHQIIKGNFQRQLEALLPPEIHVQVLGSNAEELNHMLIPSVQSRQISMEGP